ncbi:MAG: 3-deoxy-manno-octulosonate cytidylyltransferase [Pseudodesulfovibrio sp.]|uniref:3-deoxy-manno-octulosonate cytidylyltransferase n=1 Tax=Pseudodesulfovibrio aespoeensis (strain ATCC 700646 / DSM 10631 / Aspo-2) TaxID=643562 RepID=E6VTC5_PSEA9|nr:MULTISPECIES: 3-deoxy-manno-octulosonate cytidylyltransferase [Pseudodesulfovibrio]MBU4192480.1 3-deoxy-manno-octulosonate cytidylyltransferase [Pseudomonadota bacterium]ADU63284.1 3-deoxy-D-manno-octulosonate cytidylyltransferase [Pseudodesulfovibrio aespoeensis Aspo-2]MBU4245339.1 3-deoxy-manno-octulosonate cytidylyltransferase [Pseudomonadota bacterium]MBU4378159.1 3-deoxy-manno-octulosonate cytidylyltransferase [Pseudomonadota bacterium]MBU4474978.1 3-deoxy-manno-octulosonate cytidylylt
MSIFPECHGIIPARYESSRFPGKPLVEIKGRPMFWHVHNRASRCPQLGSVTLATDDARIFDAARRLDVPVVMTGSHHQSGTDRVLEAAQLLGIAPDAVVVNIQGDEPCLEPEMLTELLTPFRSPGVRVATLATPIGPDKAGSPDRVKVVRARNGRALYFSRAVVPYDRDAAPGGYLLHIGLYAFRMEALRRFGQLEPSPLELREKLEQLRLLEDGMDIYVTETRHACHGVDRPDDLEIVKHILEND